MRRILTLGADQDVENPNEDGHGWKVISFLTRKHRNSEDGSKYVPPDIGLRSKLRAGLAFYLDYYEHSLCRWSRAGSLATESWDTCPYSGIIVWDGEARHAPKKEDRPKSADVALEVYTDWCNGNCYWFSLEDGDGNLIESCGGFIGSDDVASAINEHLNEGDEVIVKGELAGMAEYMKLKGDIVDEFTEAESEAGTHVI